MSGLRRRLGQTAASSDGLVVTETGAYRQLLASRRRGSPGSNYRFQVVAVNANGAGAPSARSNNVAPR